MTHRKSILFAAIFSIIGVAALGTSTYALEDETTTTNDQPTTTQEQKRTIQERKTELQAKMTAAKEARANKLEDKRLATCEKRQAKINSILSHGTEQSRKHLAVFQKIEERTEKFYVDKHLTAEGYDAAVANANAKEAAAIAAIEASAETTFDCSNADGAKPGDAIKDLMKTRHAALKEYRTAVKDLILVVKKGHGKQQAADKPAEANSGEEE